MKFPNYLISSLAIVGAFSLIIMACATDNANSANNITPVGKYQITGVTSGGGFHVIETETGFVKTYKINPNSGGAVVYDLVSTTVTQ